MGKKHQPDWIASKILTEDTPQTIYERGGRLNAYAIGDLDNYWSKQSVQDKFEGDKNAFSTFYNKEKKNLFDLQTAERATLNDPTYKRRILIAQARARLEGDPQMQAPIITTTNPDQQGRNWGWTLNNEFSRPVHSWQKNAAKQVMTARGMMSKEEYDKVNPGALLKFAIDENGLELDDKGKSFLREVQAGEDLGPHGQIYSKDAEWWGMYDLDFGPKQFIGTLYNTPDKFFSRTINSLLEFPRVFTDTNSKKEGMINDWMNKNKYFDWNMTLEGQENQWGFESLMNMTTQGIMQLAAMVATGGAAGGITKGLGFAGKAGAVGSATGRTFMAMLVGGSTAKQARDAGHDKKETAALMFALTALTFPLMRLSEAAVGGSGGVDLTKMYQNVEQLTGIAIKKGGLKTFNPFRLKSLLLADGRRRASLNLAGLSGSVQGIPHGGGFLARAGAEGIEEAAEQIVQTSVFAISDLANAQGWTSDPESSFFGKDFEHFDWGKEIEDVGLSAVGGALAGGIGGTLLARLQKQAPKTYENMFSYAMASEKNYNRIIAHIKQKGRDGLLGNTVVQEGQTQSENDIATKNLLNTLGTLRSGVQASGLKNVFENTNEHLQKFVGDELADFLSDEEMEDLPLYTSLIKDVSALQKEQSRLREIPEPDEETVQSIDANQKKLNAIIRGDSQKKYNEEMAIFLAQAHATGRTNANRERYVGDPWALEPFSLRKLNNDVTRNFSSVKATRQAKIDNLNEASDKAKADTETFTQLTEGKKKQLSQEIDDNLTKVMNQALKDEDVQLAINGADLLDGAKIPEDASTLTPRQVLDIIDSGALDEKFPDAAKWEGQRKNIKKVKPEDIEALIQRDMFFRLLARNNDTDHNLEIKGDDIRDLVKIEEQAEKDQRIGDDKRAIEEFLPKDLNKDPEDLSPEERALTEELGGMVAYIGIEAKLNALEKTIKARIDQLTTNQIVLNQMQEKTPQLDSILYQPETFDSLMDELTTLAGKVKRLQTISNINRSNPTAIRQRLEKESMDDFRTKIYHGKLLPITVYQEILEKYEDLLNNAADDLNYDEFSEVQVKFEDEVHAAFTKKSEAESDEETPGFLDFNDFLEALNITENPKNMPALSYFAGLKAMSGSESTKLYKDTLVHSELTPAAPQAQVINEVIRGSFSQQILRSSADTSPAFTVIMNSGGGAGKSGLMLPMSALAVSNRNNEEFGAERKILMQGSNEKKAAILTAAVRKNFKNNESFVAPSEGILDLINRAEEDYEVLDAYNVIMIDEIGLMENEDFAAMLPKLNIINHQRTHNDVPPIHIMLAGDSMQVSSSTEHGVKEDPWAVDSYQIHTTSRAGFSFRSTNNELANTEKNFVELVHNKSVLFDETLYDPKTGFGLRYVAQPNEGPITDAAIQAIDAFIKQAIDRDETWAIVANPAKLDSRLQQYADNVIAVGDIQGDSRQKIVLIPSKHDIRAEAENDSYARREYYTGITRAENGALVLTDVEETLLRSARGTVFNYTSPNVAPTRELELGRIDKTLGDKEITTNSESLVMDPVHPEDFDPKGDPELIEAQLTQIAKNATAEEESVEEVTEIPTDLKKRVLTFIKKGLTRTEGGLVPLSTDRTSQLDQTTRHITSLFLTGEREGEAGKEWQAINLSYVLARVGEGDFILPEGVSNFSLDPEKGGAVKGSLGIFLEAELKGNRAIIGGFQPPAGTLDAAFAGYTIPEFGYKIAGVPKSILPEGARIKSPKFPKKKQPSAGWTTAKEISENFSMLVVSDMFVATGDVLHPNNTTNSTEAKSVPSGWGFVAVSAAYNTAEELNAAMEDTSKKRDKDTIKYIPIDPRNSKGISQKQLEQFMLDALVAAEDIEFFDSPTKAQNTVVNGISDVFWNAQHKISNKAVEKNKASGPKRTVILDVKTAQQVEEDIPFYRELALLAEGKIKEKKEGQKVSNIILTDAQRKIAEKLLPVLMRRSNILDETIPTSPADLKAYIETVDPKAHWGRTKFFYDAMKAKMWDERINGGGKIADDLRGALQRVEKYNTEQVNNLSGITKKEYTKARSLITRVIKPGLNADYQKVAKSYLAIADGNILKVYKALMLNMSLNSKNAADNHFFRPDFVLGKGITGAKYSYAKTIELPGEAKIEHTNARVGKGHSESNLSRAQIHLSTGLEGPTVWMNLDVASKNLTASVRADVVNDESYDEKIIKRSKIASDPDGDAQIDGERGERLLSFINTFYKGRNSFFASESINYFRRRVHDAIYVTTAPNARIRNLDEGIKALKAEFKENSMAIDTSKSDLFTRQGVPEKENIRQAYHDSVIAAQFDWFLGYTSPDIIIDDGQYRLFSSHKTDPGIDKEQSSLGSNTSEVIKSLIYGTPSLNNNSDGTFDIVKKPDYETELGNSYLTMNSIPDIIDIMSTSHHLVEPDNSLSTRDQVRLALKDKRFDAPIIESLYQRFYADEPFSVNGIPQSSFLQIKSVTAANFLTALENYLLSSVYKRYHMVDTRELESPLPVDYSVGRIGPLEIGAIKQINLLKNSKDGVLLTGDQYKIKGRLYDFTGEPNFDKLKEFYNLLGIPLVEPMLGSMARDEYPNHVVADRKANTTSARDRVLLDLQIGANAIADNMRTPESGVGDVKILKALGKAEAHVLGSAFNHYIRTAKGTNAFILQKGAPIYKALSVFSSINDASPLQGNLFNPKQPGWRLRDFIIKSGIRGDNLDNASENANLSPEESAEIDIIHGFLHPLKKRGETDKGRNVAAIPFVVNADAGTAIVPIVELPRSIRDTGYLANTIQDYITSENQFYGKMERNIIDRWNDSKLSDKNIKTIKHVQTAAKKLTPKQALASSLFENVDYAIIKVEDKDGNVTEKVVFKSRLADKIAAAKKLSVNKVKKDSAEAIKNLTAVVKGKKGLWEKIGDAGQIAGIGNNPAKAIEFFYYTWLTASTNMRHLGMGSNFQYDGIDETPEFINLVKRARPHTAPATAQNFRAEAWSNGIEPTVDGKNKVFEVDLTKETVNGKKISALNLLEGYKPSRLIRVAVVKDITKKHTLTSGEVHTKEILDGVTHVTGSYREFQKAANGGEYGNETPAITKPITYSNNNGRVVVVKNSESTLTPELMRTATDLRVQSAKNLYSHPLEFQVKLKGEVAKTPFDILKILKMKEDFSNATDSHFKTLAKVLVMTNNQNSLISEEIPISSMKTGVTRVNEFGAAKGYNTILIDQSFKGLQLNASKDLFADGTKHTTTFASQISAAITLGQDTTAINSLRGSIKILTDLAAENIGSKDLKGWKTMLQSNIHSSEELSSLLSLSQRLSGADHKSFSMSDRAIFRFGFPILVSAGLIPGISPKFAGGDYIIQPADDVIALYENIKTGEILLKSSIKDVHAVDKDENPVYRERSLRYSEPLILHNGKKIGITEHPDFKKLENNEDRAKWIADQTDLEEGLTEVIVSRALITQAGLDIGNLQPHQVTEDYFYKQEYSRRLGPNSDLSVAEALRIVRAVQEGETPKKTIQGRSVVQQLADYIKPTPAVGEAHNETELDPSKVLTTEAAEGQFKPGDTLSVEAIMGELNRKQEDYKKLLACIKKNSK
jgi:hypothetical protein